MSHDLLNAGVIRRNSCASVSFVVWQEHSRFGYKATKTTRK